MNDPIRRMQQHMQSEGFDLLAVNPGPTLRYLTGLDFHLMERPVLLFIPASGEPVMVLPELENPRLREALPALQSFPYGESESDRMGALRLAAEQFPGAQRVGVEPLRMRFFEVSLLGEAANAWEFNSASDLITDLRIIKNEGEVELMRQAVRIAEAAMLETMPLIRPGVSEHELAAELTLQLNRAGSQPELPFFPIIASGPNSALPHATPTARILEPGDLLIIDWGARVGGYISDLTRTFAIESIHPELETIHLIVQQANDAGRDSVRPGETCGAVDLATRAIIEAAGYGEAFIHRTGHGIGLEPHEEPYIVSDNLKQLSMGMTFTVEPGIYLPGRGGVRIEDNLVVTEKGGESLSKIDRSLLILP